MTTIKNGRKKETQFKKGWRGGPGRPRKEQCFADITRQMLDANKIDIRLTLPSGKITEIGLQASPTIRHGIVASMIREAFNGNTTAAQQLMDRTDGKVMDKVQHVGDGLKVEIEYVDSRKRTKDQALPAATT